MRANLLTYELCASGECLTGVVLSMTQRANPTADGGEKVNDL
jgi:hypothetical protein